MRIAVYSGAIPSSSFIENIINGLASEGHTVLLFGQCAAPPKYANKLVKLRATPINPVLLVLFVLKCVTVLLFKRPSVLSKVNVLMKQEGIADINDRIKFWGKVLPVLIEMPDVFHIQWIKAGHKWLFLRDFGIKVVGSFRGAHINYSPVADKELASLYRDTFYRYDAFHAVSNTIKSTGSQYLTSPRLIVVIPGAVNDNVVADSLSPSVPIKGTLKILSIGRDHWIKGYMFALDACKMLKDMGVDFEYTIIGGEGSEELIYQVSDLGLTDHVKLHGAVSHNGIWDHYRQSHLFLLPSLDEGIANVALEAMAVGVPVLSTACGGMPEVISDGYNGWLVPVRDANAIARKINEIVRLESGEVDRIRGNALTTIRENHLASKQINRYISFYHMVIGGV